MPHSILKKKFSMFFSSDTATGAYAVSQDGSEFSVKLNNPLTIPSNCLDCSLSVIQANIWNVSPNIAEIFGNNVFAFVVAETPIVLSGDDATQKTILTFTGVGDRVDFTVANSVREVLGFDSRIAPPLPGAPSVGFNEFSDNSAQFNRTNSYLITSNIVSGGIPINSTSANIIASVPPISVAPGSQIVYAPRNPLAFSGNELVGAIKNSFNFQLRNQSLEATPTVNELWSLVILFEYSVPV
jgi:hypothetical protein